MMTKLSTFDTSDREVNPGIFFWNESANETDSDTEEESNGDIEEEDPKTEKGRQVLVGPSKV